MPPTRTPQQSADRFADAFARHAPVPSRGLLPGVRVWAAVGGAAALTVAVALSAARLPQSAAEPADAGAGRPVQVAAVGPPPPVSAPAAHPAGPPRPATRTATPAPTATAAPGTPPPAPPVAAAPGGVATAPTAAAETKSPPKSTPGSTPGSTSGATTRPPAAPATHSPAPQQARTAPTPALVPGYALVGYGSNRCVDITGGVGNDGTPLELWDCTGADWQKWDFRPDGTVRSMGLCMDVAWGSVANGTTIQVARCSGNPAQQFVLTGAGDLVNPQADKCVDAKDGGTGSGVRLQLWDCTGAAGQKWHVR
ncbi:ricin-type beta-trefoil lectin domain protein [Streptomyces sp. NPDC092296]|uniref:ricin-type beta-trefoil lectin domain protein n=1 Tax=Streptomyces sp. NPDC092296 TaxID=3366012 RepID=UPI00382453AC